MTTPLLAVKLYRPRPRPRAVARPQLIARLNASLHHRLTLVSAPAGFGKTTLVSAWADANDRPAAWLSLDGADNDPMRFLAYLIAALRTIVPTLGSDTLAAMQSQQVPPIELLLTPLLNDLAVLPQPISLILDDYHTIDAPSVAHALALLVEHLPPPLHLLIVTREDPPLPLARLRARGHLVELRAADMRFTLDEAAGFLNEVMGLKLAATDIATLEERTEGWIAGLQLAALSIQQHQDASAFIRDFAGDHRYILDYLVDEVLQHQPVELRDFLLQTAILERLTGPLCDAVTGQTGSRARLEALDRSNFFLVPLDDTRHWYRYHHLFGDMLAAQLRAEHPDLLTTLHRRASLWYEQQGAAAEAIRHALAAQDVAHVADLLELAAPTLYQSRQEITLLAWFRELPDKQIANRPVLCVYYAGTLLAAGDLIDVERWLREAEHWLDLTTQQPARSQSGSVDMIVRDETAFQQLPSSIAVYRAAYALALGDLPQSETYARQALQQLGVNEHVKRGAASGLLGLACWTRGDLAAAYRLSADSMAQLQQAGYIADAIGGSIMLADMRIVQGRLHEAMQLYQQRLQLAMATGAPQLRGTADMLVGISEILCERNELVAAIQHAQRCQTQGEHTGFPQHPYRWRVALAQIHVAQGDLDGALRLLDEAEQRYVSDFFPNLRPVAALKTRIWLAQGRLHKAIGWVREQGLSSTDALSYLHEFAHITLARVLLAQAQQVSRSRYLPEAKALLQRLRVAAETGERTGSLIEILILQALAEQQLGDLPAALAPLSRALELAEPEGYIRMFVNEGAAMALLLEAAARQNLSPAYVRQLRQTLGAVAAPPPFPPELIEPLSERERDVLRLLRTELDGPAIARQLIISLNTLRTHTKHIYAKLGVTNRRMAVRRADELDLR